MKNNTQVCASHTNHANGNNNGAKFAAFLRELSTFGNPFVFNAGGTNAKNQQTSGLSNIKITNECNIDNTDTRPQGI